MEAKELRIGNLVYQIAEWGEPIDKKLVEWSGDIWYRVGECLLYLEDFEPIPLTEEWLVKFGFENLDFPNEFNFGSFCVRLNTKDRIFRYITNDGNVRPVIKHVHQLQNLYFALTENELKINDNG